MKTASLIGENPGAARLIAALLGTGLLASDQAHTAELEREAALMTEAARELEERKMRQTIGALDQKYASAEREVGRAVKIAAAITASRMGSAELLTLLGQQGMDKEALDVLAPLARAGGSVLKGIGGAASAAGRLGRQLQQGPGPLMRAGGWLSGKGHALSAAGAKAAPALKATENVLQEAAPAAAAAAPAAAKAKPLMSMGTKGKLLAGGALLGTGYVGMKGMQAARDFMMAPSEHHGAPVMQNVNQYGYPQY